MTLDMFMIATITYSTLFHHTAHIRLNTQHECQYE